MGYDYSLLNKKIKELMNKEGMSQKKLAELLNVHPSRITQTFRYGDRFTLEQFEMIADHFGMSLGDLFNLTKELTAQDICKSLIDIFNSYRFRFEPIKKTEKYWKASDDHSHSPTDQEFPYTAIYFPNVWEVENEDDEQLASIFGNISANRCIINAFLTRLYELNEMKHKGDIDQDTYNTQVEKYLKEAGPASKEDKEDLEREFKKVIQSWHSRESKK